MAERLKEVLNLVLELSPLYGAHTEILFVGFYDIIGAVCCTIARVYKGIITKW